jgi:hypothetical protein
VTCSELTDVASSTTAIVFLTIVYIVCVAFLAIVARVTLRDARNVKIYESRIGQLERDLIPTSNLVLGQVSRHNSTSWPPPMPRDDLENFEDLYETMPSQYRHSVTSSRSFLDCETRRSSCSDVVRHQNQVKIFLIPF